MVPFLIAAILLSLASLTAVFATERCAHSLYGPRGWTLTLVLAAGAVCLLCVVLGIAEAAAVAIVLLMAGIPTVATLVHWRQRQGIRHGE